MLVHRSTECHPARKLANVQGSIHRVVMSVRTCKKAKNEQLISIEVPDEAKTESNEGRE